MMHAQDLHRGRGRPRKPPVEASMASALTIYQIDLNDMAVVYRVLWRAGFRYEDAMAHAEEAVAAARRLRRS